MGITNVTQGKAQSLITTPVADLDFEKGGSSITSGGSIKKGGGLKKSGCKEAPTPHVKRGFFFLLSVLNGPEIALMGSLQVLEVLLVELCMQQAYGRRPR